MITRIEYESEDGRCVCTVERSPSPDAEVTGERFEQWRVGCKRFDSTGHGARLVAHRQERFRTLTAAQAYARRFCDGYIR